LPSGVLIPALTDFVGDLSLATTLAKDGARLQTVEHLLSALCGLGVDHALIEAGGDELPVLDGSASPWVKAICQTGLRDLPNIRRYIKIKRPVHVAQGVRSVSVRPHKGFKISYTIDFPGTYIGRQSMELSITPEKYSRELSSARTFCLKNEIDYMQSRGLAQGGSLDNAVVYDGSGYLNDSLRFANEAVRHKMLDLVGDFALLGAPLLGCVEARAAGHALHVALAKKLLSEPDAWVLAEAEPAYANSLFQPGFAQGLAAG
jgi:UDP-3-O-[3-hydroxymyristoyl] N-acetylglucosamine deacetylase